MPEIHYINFNGSIVDASQPVLMHTNRAFRYGDAVFETIRLMHGDILFFEKHLARLRRSMEMLSMEWPETFSFQQLHLLIRHLDQVNNLGGNARIRLEVYRNEGGFYTPLKNDVGFIIEAEPIKDSEYVLNKTGLRVDLYNEMPKLVNKLSTIKTSSALPHVMAGLHRKKSGYDDSLIFNIEGNIAEAVSSNVFIMLNGDVFTPSLDQGCVAGVMRERIIEVLKTKNKKCQEKKISLNELLHADEVFLTNVIDGIRWVGAIRNKRYFNSFSSTLVAEITKVAVKKS
jgi:branched-subunit amino acid aminotransferase/4-amino-4-deoxychorismate lyase